MKRSLTIIALISFSVFVAIEIAWNRSPEETERFEGKWLPRIYTRAQLATNERELLSSVISVEILLGVRRHREIIPGIS